ncbi:MAG: PilZ domain-containing protein [Actinobacteria bacterium ATB1]|nr:PilZ domain-containing protein [Actinobacteria bacterium ATB1]
MTVPEGGVPVPDQRVIVTWRTPGLDAYETSAVVERVGDGGIFEVRLRAGLRPSAEREALHSGAQITVDGSRDDGLWRLQARIVGVDEVSGSAADSRRCAGWSGGRITLRSVGGPRRIDVRRFHRLHVWTPLRRVDLDAAAPQVRSGLPWSPDPVLARSARDALAQVPLVERAFSLGAGGLAFVPNRPVETGALLFVHLEEPVLDIEAFGHVVWTHREGESQGQAGVEFVGLTVEDQDRLLDYVLERRMRAPRPQDGGARTPRAATTG